MRIDVITLFPDWVKSLKDYGVVGRALRDKRVLVNCWNPRDFGENKNRRIDDRPFGGGPGMVMQYQPLENTLHAIWQSRVDAGLHSEVPVLMLSPRGERFNQYWAQDLSAREQGLILLCGRYEGIDQRFIDVYVNALISIGDVVLSGGELPAMMVIDAIVRLLPGVLGDDGSAQQDSFSEGKLDHPHYTRPAHLKIQDVPKVLLSGDHAAIAAWRERQALGWTWLHRPDLLEGLALSGQQKILLQDYIDGQRD